MGKFLTGAFSLGLMLLLVGYGQPGPKSAGLLVSAGWFAVLWPAVALMIALPVHALAKAGQRFSAPDPERRRLLSGAASWIASAAAGPAALVGIAAAGREPVVRRVPIPIESRHSGLKGVRIVQICDLHLSRWSDPDRVADLAASPILMRPSPGRTTPPGRTGPPPGPNRPTTGSCRPRPFCPAPAACTVPRCSTYRFLIPNVVSS